MVNYQEAKIYKLVGGGLTYYGSSCQDLYKRLYDHKHKYKLGIKTYSSYKLFETGDKVEIILVEKFPCKDREELLSRERFYIENNECVNIAIPFIPIEEITDKRKLYQKKYNKMVKEKLETEQQKIIEQFKKNRLYKK